MSAKINNNSECAANLSCNFQLPDNVFINWFSQRILFYRSNQSISQRKLFYSRPQEVINLQQLCFWLSSAVASIIFGFIFDSKLLGNRRRRSIIAAALVAALLIGSHSGLIFFLASHDINRHKHPIGIDWSDGNSFSSLLVIYIFLGFSSYVFQNYLLWLLATFSNDPSVLSRFSGFVEALKALGVITSFAIDSERTQFLTEEVAYFSLNVVGLGLCTVSAILYTQDTVHESESDIIAPSLIQPAMSPESSHLGTPKTDTDVTALGGRNE